MISLIEAVQQRRKGHWGLIEPAYAAHELSDLVELIEQTQGLEFFRVDCCSRGEREFASFVEDLGRDIELQVQEAIHNNQKCVCCLLESFDCLPSRNQCRLLEITRRLREESVDLEFQTIIHGCWNRFRLQAVWKNEFSAASSVPDQSRIRSLEGTSIDQLTDQLAESGWITRFSSDRLDRIAVEALLEFTGGDVVLIDEVLAVLKSLNHRLQAFQETEEGVVDSEQVICNFSKRISELSSEACLELRNLLISQVRIVERRDRIVVEDLRLLGFIRCSRLSGGRHVAMIASPLMDKVLRRNWNQLFSCSDIPEEAGEDIVWPLRSINRRAYEIVLEIEGLLRNWLVSVLSDSGELGWTDALRGIRVPGNPLEIAAENLQSEMLPLFKALFPNINPELLDDSNSELKKVPTEKKKGASSNMEDVVQSAENWRRRHLAHPSVKLAAAGLPSFFTTGALTTIYTAKKNKNVREIVDTAFPRREDLLSLLEKFNSVRSAVAHNQILALDVLTVLEGIHQGKRDIIGPRRYSAVRPVSEPSARICYAASRIAAEVRDSERIS